MYSPDGRFTREGAETAYNVLKAFDPDVRNAKIDLAATYTDQIHREGAGVKIAHAAAAADLLDLQPKP